MRNAIIIDYINNSKSGINIDTLDFTVFYQVVDMILKDIILNLNLC